MTTPERPKALSFLATTLATWFGCGLAPKAPGTVGSLGAWPLHWALATLPGWLHGTLLALLSAVGVWASQWEAERTGLKDPGRVVIDEAAGVLIALGLGAPSGLGYQLLAVVLFRILDITKPGPIRRAEKMPPMGLGIMADDIVAGVVAGLLTRLAPLLLGMLG